MTDEAVGVVTELWRFPVKSMQGERIAEGQLTSKGIVGDRRYAARDAVDGRVLSAKRYGKLLMASARTDGDGTVVVSLGEAGEHAADDPAVHDVLSAWLDHSCRLEPPPAEEQVEFEMSLDADAPDTDTFNWPCPSGTYLDLAAAHVLTTASLEAAAALHPDGQWDVRRFRPTALVDMGDAVGFVEDQWVGTSVRLGEAVLSVDMPTIRCPMPTRAQPDLPRDLAVAHTLRDHHASNLGIYATVTTPGRIAVGDPVRPA